MKLKTTTTTTTAAQQHPKTHAKQTTNYSIKASLIAYLSKYGWQLVVKLLCVACSWQLCALAYHSGSTSR